MSRNSRDGRTQRRRRIGFLLANIHTGSGNTIWPALVDEAESRQVDLLFFPGGRLGAPDAHEASRNSVFSLANPASVDGLLSWASAIGGHTPVELLERFHASYGSLPTITLNQRIGSLPLHTIDSYTGMRSLMGHLLDVHAYRRVAFVQGPASHPAAQERYRAVRDALRERGMPLDARLVTNARPWDSGTRPIEELLDQRNLHPGRDFDVLVAASDLLLFDTVRLLQKRGYRVPEDCPVAGFNDSMESRMLVPAFTTVRMPFVEQSVAAFRSLLDLLDGAPIPEVVSLPSRLVVRQSCGCDPGTVTVPRDGEGGAAAGQGATAAGGDEVLIADILETLQGDREDRAAWIEPLVHAFQDTRHRRDPDAFLGTLQRILTHVMQLDREIHVWQDVITALRRHHYAAHPGGLDGFLEDLFHRARQLVSGTLHTAHTFKQWHDGRLLRTLGDLDKDLLAVRDRDSISGILSRHLPPLDIRSAYVVLYETGGSLSRLIAAFQTGRTDGIARPVDLPPKGAAFPASRLLPGSVFPESLPGTYMVQPLTIDERAVGYTVLRVGLRQGYLYEEIRGILSSALNGMFLLEETGRALKTAERAQQLKSRFLVNVGSELQAPVRTLDGLARSLGSLVEAGNAAGAARVRTHIRKIRALARHQVRVTDDLLDLALTQVQDLPLRRQAADPLDMVRDAAAAFAREAEGQAPRLDLPPRLPLVEADPARFTQILGILLRHAAATCRKGSLALGARLAPGCLDVWVTGRRGTARTEGEGPLEGVALSLAHNLAALHGGVLEVHEEREREYRLVLRHPLPTLGEGNAPLATPAGGGALVLSSDGIAPPESRALAAGGGAPRIVEPWRLLEEPDLLSGSPTLLWDAAASGFSDWSFIRALRRVEACLRLPCAVFADEALAARLGSGPESGLAGLIEAVASERLPGPVMVLDPDPRRRANLVGQIGGGSGIEEIVAVGSVGNLVLLLQDCRPSLILLGEIDEGIVRTLRSIPRTSGVPIVILTDTPCAQDPTPGFADAPGVVLYNRGILSPSEMVDRIRWLRRGKARMLPPPTSLLVKRAIAYINRNATTPITRWKLAEAVSVSEDYLGRVFRQETGLSPWEYLKRYRVHLACAILRSTGDSLKSVAAQAGFRDQTYFCRVFRSVLGRTPGEYRAELETGGRSESS